MLFDVLRGRVRRADALTAASRAEIAGYLPALDRLSDALDRRDHAIHLFLAASERLAAANLAAQERPDAQTAAAQAEALAALGAANRTLISLYNEVTRARSDLGALVPSA